MNNKYGYKGSETALNGLTYWIEKINYSIGVNQKGKQIEIYNYNLQFIIEFGKLHIENMPTYRNIVFGADYVAKWIKKNNYFPTFKKWYKEFAINTLIPNNK